MNPVTRPKDALVHIDGSFYKIGLRRMVFVFDGGEWVRSSKTITEINQYMERRLCQL